MMVTMPFADRTEAGRRLAVALEYLRPARPVVVGLPRGGVVVAAEVARALRAPLDVIVVRKLGMPLQPELAMGAIGEDGARVVDRALVRMAGLTPSEVAAVEYREKTELDRRARVYRGDRPRIPLAGRTVVVVDDGVATGATARAACQVARAQGAGRVVLAVPVAPEGWERQLAGVAEELVALLTPRRLTAVGQWYVDFAPVGDDEVVAALVDSTPAAPTPPGRRPAHEEVEIPSGSRRLCGLLTVPAGASGLVVFAHGSGSSRLSPRNRFVADVLHGAGLGTLLFDLLTPQEETERANVFDIPLLAGRLADATRWLAGQPDAEHARIGYFGASTGAAAALWAAAEDGQVAAVVSRGGRPDLAGPRLGDVTVPTMLVVGGDDETVLELNRWAQARLHCPNRLEVVPGASHLFAEPGTLRRVAELARDWFVRHLVLDGAAAGAPAN